jgi:outer membrane protein OmpA-like peptidoglycan-associated protein
MAMNLIDLAKSYLTPEVIQKASAMVGESPTSTRHALETATPAIFAGLAGEASSTSGAGQLVRVLDETGLVGPMGRITERLGSGSGEELTRLGKDLLGRVFGGRLSSLVDVVGSACALKTSTTSSLMGLAAPLVLGVIGNQIHERHLDAAGVAGLLAEQKGAALAALPPSVAAVFGGVPAARVEPPREVKREAAREPVRAKTPQGYGLWPLVLLLPMLIIGLLMSRSHREETPVTAPAMGVGIPREITPEPQIEPQRPVETAPPVEAPKPPEVEKPRVIPQLAEGTIGHDLGQFLGSSGGDASKRFVFEHLGFEFGTTDLTPGSLPALESVAAALRAYPDARVVVEGHTDSIGAPETNERLSLDRASLLKNALVARGVAADRITTKGVGQEHPIASNDTPEGRARNRRIELIVTR